MSNYLYQAYGLKISSPVPLAALPPASGQPDVTVSVNRRFVPSQAAKAEDWTYRIDRSEAEIRHPKLCSFRIREGRQVEIEAVPEFDDQFLQVYLVGLVMAVVLYQRSYFVLHASAAELDTGAIAFLGHTGAGKSSLVASLHRRGARILADDNTALDLTSITPIVIPGFPELKVIPEIAASLGYEAESLRRFHPALQKMGCSIEAGYSANPIGLRRMYVLSRAAEQPVSPIGRPSAVIQLVRHSMPSRIGVKAGADHLLQCSQVAESVPMYLIRTFDSLDEISALAKLVEDHAANDELVLT